MTPQLVVTQARRWLVAKGPGALALLFLASAGGVVWWQAWCLWPHPTVALTVGAVGGVCVGERWRRELRAARDEALVSVDRWNGADNSYQLDEVGSITPERHSGETPVLSACAGCGQSASRMDPDGTQWCMACDYRPARTSIGDDLDPEPWVST